MASASKSIPFVVPAQHSPAVNHEAITQTELDLFVALRARVEQIQKQIAEHEASFMARLEAGAGVESGIHIAQLNENFRRNVSWKAVCVRLANRLKMNGEGYTRRVLASTKPTRSVSLEIL